MSPEQLAALNTTLSLQVHRALRDLGWTQRHLAARAGLDPATISRILDGCGCNTASLEKIAKALQREAADLLRIAA